MKFVRASIAQALFDHGGLRAVLEHARNLLVATIIVAAVFETVKNSDTIHLPGLSNPFLAGYVVAGTGADSRRSTSSMDCESWRDCGGTLGCRLH
ncbi:hypothetical protein [Paraburkholderia caledonica]|uniref:hypothetical protein n=1 Tax=Paraburkholderia caledonica TaxID=134536 RepID=UPI0038B72D4B